MTTTQSCAECGVSAEPGQSFCDACGAVLSWKDRAGARTAPTPDDTPASDAVPARDTVPAATAVPARDTVPAATAAAAGPRTLTTARPEPPEAPATPTATVDAQAPEVPEARDSAPPIDDTAPTEPVRRAATTPEREPGPHGDAEPGAEPAGDGEPPADPMSERARRLLIPVADPDPRPTAPPSVAPVLPGRPVAQRPQTVRTPGQELGADGGIACPWCGTPNHPDRHYCARCAMPMAAEGRATGHRPWWRRLFGFGNQETPWAGDRPRLRRTFDRIVTWLGAALVLTLLIVLAVNIPRGIQATKDHFSKRAPVAPDKVTASRSYPGHKADLAFDKLNNTWWGPGITASGQGQWIEARFTDPTRLLDLVVTPGTSTRQDQISQSALPHRLKATIKTADGKTTTRELTLDQGAGGQRRPFRVKDALSVRFTLETAYGAADDKQVAIAEIEFFGPSHASSS